MESTYNHVVYSKEGKIYDVRCTKVSDTLRNLSILDNIADIEKTDLYVVPYEGQLVIISEKEMLESESKLEDILKELKEEMVMDIDHYGCDVLKFDRAKKSLTQV